MTPLHIGDRLPPYPRAKQGIAEQDGRGQASDQRLSQSEGEAPALPSLTLSEWRFRELLMSLSRVAVQGYDRDRRVIYWNSASQALYGYSEQEALGRRLEELLIPDAMVSAVIDAHQAWVCHGTEIPPEELELKHRSGATVPVFSHHVMLAQGSDNPLMFCIDIDLAGERQARRDLDYMTRFDRLTGLPNRHAFEHDLAGMLEECRLHDDSLLILFIDLDRFNEINDTHGYEYGDKVIREAARRLKSFRRSHDLLARFGTDEFVLAMPRVDVANDATQVADRLLESIARPMRIQNRELRINASVGLSLYPDNGSAVQELVGNADAAKTRAKQEGRNTYRFFSPEAHAAMVRQHRIAASLQRLLDQDGKADKEGELSLAYQPQVSASSGYIDSMEALLRWTTAEGECISPGEFIPVAERSELITRLGDWVLHHACQQQQRWRQQGLRRVRVDINISGRHAMMPGMFEECSRCVASYGLGPQDIGIELTENVLIEAGQSVLDSLRCLYDQGYKIAIDDFGTGFSSMSYLKFLPVTALKIDRTFVAECTQDPKDRAIMEASIFLGHRLGLEVIAEGVETAEQEALLQEMRCDLLQGYYYHRPTDAASIARLLRAGPLGLSGKTSSGAHGSREGNTGTSKGAKHN
ncbi:EAL domain-containing protein [Halomonas denitrificans]|uniref:putative bifunctional diguanylate cyclase/phosphodiesterase n=1 Tax=Halomonas denitrificans TaxID=370769 RepID=UPI001CD77723|nr:EAL domain-containing protein [Halomonas denitrificans]MCA0976714.1 EAL domain-containing protein [Halomonas denitrificans]